MAIEPKKINYDVLIKSTNHTRSYALPPEVYTSDTAVQFRFNILDVEAAEFNAGAAVSTVEITTRDGSFFQYVGETSLEGTTVVYDLKEAEGKHAGLAKIQLKINLGGDYFTSDEYEFKILNTIATGVPVEIYVQNWETLTTQAEAYITQMAQDIEEFDVALETGVLATNIAAKLISLETTYAPDMLAVKQQLEQKINHGEVSVSDINKNLGKLDQTYLSDALLQQIAGITPVNAVPADYSITTQKIAFNPILGNKSKNLFNQNTIVSGKYLDIATGLLIDNASYFVSDFIKVSPNAAHYLKSNVNARTTFYDVNKAYISGSFTSSAAFTTTAATEYVRLTSVLTSLADTQLELGTAYTGYESFSVKIDNSAFLPNSLNGEALSKKTLALEKIDGFTRGKNLFNKLTSTAAQSLNGNTGIPFTNVDYYVSDFISIDPSTQYAIGPVNAFTKVCFYTASKGFISVATDGVTNFTTPSNAAYIRFSNYNASLALTQVELGATATTFADYMEDLSTLRISERIAAQTGGYAPLYKFNDAWVAWKNGEKFPMAFFGDSTIDGMGTTGFSGSGLGTANVSPNTFSAKLQTLLRTITGNNILRIYNAGFSGMKIDWGLTNIAAEFTGAAAYADVKMVGIGFGINDRLSYQTDKAFRTGFKSNVKAIIDWFYAHDIQPFLVTTQALNSPSVETQYKVSFPLRTAMHIDTIANEVKRELAEEYNLEIVDIHKFTEEFLLYSAYPAKTIISDRTHFGDIGHNYEAGMLFYHITPMAINANGYTKVDYSSQKLQVGVPEELVTVPDSPSDAFKLYANYTKGDSLDTKIMDAYVFNSGKKLLTLKAYKSDLSSLTYVKVDGVTTTLSALETVFSSLELGLHRLEVYSGLSAKVDFKGFIIE